MHHIPVHWNRSAPEVLMLRISCAPRFAALVYIDESYGVERVPRVGEDAHSRRRHR